MIMGLMLAISACSAAPSREEVVRDILFETIKGSYVSYPGTFTILQQSGGNFAKINSAGAITINSLDFVVPVADPKDTEIKFKYIELLDDTWFVYKVTYDGTVRYTALMADKFWSVTGIAKVITMEAYSHNDDQSLVKFRDSKAEIDPQKMSSGRYTGSIFLKLPTQDTQDQSIIESTVIKTSN